MLVSAEKVHPEIEMCCGRKIMNETVADDEEEVNISLVPPGSELNATRRKYSEEQALFGGGSLKRANEIGRKLSDLRHQRVLRGTKHFNEQSDENQGTNNSSNSSNSNAKGGYHEIISPMAQSTNMYLDNSV